MVNQQANVNVTLNNEQAKQELNELQNQMKELIKLRREAAKAGDTARQAALAKEIGEARKEATQLEKQLFDVNKVLRNINGASLNDLRKSAQLLTAQMSKLERGTVEYVQAAAKLKLVNKEIASIGAQTRATGSTFGRMADGFNRYFALFTAWTAGFAGLLLGVKAAIQAFNDFEERVSNLSALTGLAGDDLKWLSQQAKDLSTSTLESGIRVTQSAKDIVDAFTKVGSARPELLKNKEALVEVTKEAIILSNAAKTELQPAIEALTMVMNQYNLPATEARRIINSIAAGSKEGAGEIPYITQAFEKAGTVAADAGISIETLVATIETLAPRITQPEIAGRGLKAVLLKLQEGADDTNPAIVGLATALENLGKKSMSITELTNMFGMENITVAKILLNNVGELKKYEKAVTSTSVAIEQAAINTANNNAKLLQAKNRINIVAMELGEKLSPAYASIIGKTSLLLKSVSALINVFINYGRIILGATVAVAAYTIALRLNTAEKRASFMATKLGMAIEKGYAVVKALVTGQINLATIAQRAWNTAVKANPVGAIIAVVVAAAAAIWQYSKNLNEATAAQKSLNDVEIEAQQSIVAQKLAVNDLISIAASEKQSLDNRKKALEELNKISPEYFGNLTLESVKTNAAKVATDLYTESLLTNARVQAAQAKLIELEKKRLEETLSGTDYKTTGLQSVWNFIKAGGNTIGYMANEAVTGVKNSKKAADEYMQQQEALTKFIEKNRAKQAVSAIVADSAPDKPKGTTTGSSGSKREDLLMQLAETKNQFELLSKHETDYTKLQYDELEKRKKQNQQYADDQIRNLEDLKNAEQDLFNARLDLASSAIDVLIKLAGEETKAGKALFLLDQARAIGQIIFNTGIANAKAVAASPLTLGQPWVAINTATAAASIAGIIGQSIARLSNKSKGDKTAQHAVGKYPVTGAADGRTYDADYAGRPKTGFYSGPQLGLFNEDPGRPEMVVDGRTTRQLLLNYPAIVQGIRSMASGNQPQFATGRYPSSPGSTAVGTGHIPSGGGQQGGQLDNTTAIALIAAINKLLQWQPKVYTETIKKQLDTLNDIEQNRGL